MFSLSLAVRNIQSIAIMSGQEFAGRAGASPWLRSGGITKMLHMRMNLGTSRKLIELAMDNMAAAMDKL